MTAFRHQLTLLIIDDDVVSISTLTSLFAKNFNIEIAQDGKSALQSIMLKDIDLVLSVVNSPIISGQELCTFVKNSQLTAHIPVMFLAEAPNLDEEDECLQMGAVDYIDKKIRPSILVSRVTNQMTMVAQQKKLAQVSCTDGLTGLANRMQLDTMLNKEWYAAVRGSHSIAALMIDIDHFKLFNDEFGHLEGDACLKIIASIIASSKRRERDLAARYGGEEFVLLLPFTDLKGAKQVAQELIESVKNCNIKSAKQASFPIVTVSIGISAFSPTLKKNAASNPIDLIDRADINLFKAKQAGRNQYSASS
ncbi:GGDEF domain-containing response regulator [Paraglaciecola arctica]|uniref:GGDEF domain-containing response regulator n=1 Tax=Paraglaciecola arctica TaxID=1128911 RepID=UPI001C071109|nr:diguanylate cyclase [Paraglaciecola arctica]MBU3005100.1 diguanylate cyclase [Paraglaciecola arctica]